MPTCAGMTDQETSSSVIPAKVGIQFLVNAFAQSTLVSSSFHPFFLCLATPMPDDPSSPQNSFVHVVPHPHRCRRYLLRTGAISTPSNSRFPSYSCLLIYRWYLLPYR